MGDDLCGKKPPLLNHPSGKKPPLLKYLRPLPRRAAQPVTEEELREILDRLGAARDIFRQNRELREVLSRRETETRELRSRNAELEEIVRKFAPMLLDAATTMGLAAKNEKPDTQPQFARAVAQGRRAHGGLRMPRSRCNLKVPQRCPQAFAGQGVTGILFVRARRPVASRD